MGLPAASTAMLVKTSRAGDTNIDLANRVGEPLGSPPLRELTGIRPSPEDHRARRVEHARDGNFTFSEGRLLCNSHHHLLKLLRQIAPSYGATRALGLAR